MAIDSDIISDIINGKEVKYMNFKKITLLALIGISIDALVKLSLFISNISKLILNSGIYSVAQIIDLFAYSTIVLFLYVLWKNQEAN
ncbi:MAG: hypothetical protein P4L49_01560 [Desulfosporosinus sp.]|nr:hypothetical protein [Desulfosporosinus sp.]